jgi:hypothetical protein
MVIIKIILHFQNLLVSNEERCENLVACSEKGLD